MGKKRIRHEIVESDWKISVYRQHCRAPFLPFCAVAERSDPGKRWLVNAEGRTPDEAIRKLKAHLATIGKTW